ESLTQGMRSLEISLAKHLLKLARKRGLEVKSAFRGRYFTSMLKTPSQVKNALRYVFFNFSKHKKSTKLGLDPYSSACTFHRWDQLLNQKELRVLAAKVIPLKGIFLLTQKTLAPPSFWLLKV